jgi:hypothetical protein
VLAAEMAVPKPDSAMEPPVAAAVMLSGSNSGEV